MHLEVVYSRLIFLLLFEIIFIWFVIRNENNFWVKSFLLFSFGGFIVYNGIGAIYKETPAIYLQYLVVFQLFYYWAFRVGYLIFVRSKLSNKMIKKETRDRFSFIKSSYWLKIIIIGYLLLCITKLVYPEFLLYRLAKPPIPDVMAFLSKEVDKVGRVNAFTQIVYYLSIMLMPFYYLALSIFKKHPKWLFLFLILPLYVTYCENSYISRGSMMRIIFIAVLAIFYFLPHLRKRIIIFSIASIPFLISFLYAYSIIRQNGNLEESNISFALSMLFKQETEFPTFFEKVVRYEGSYYREFLSWLFTLPFPKFGMSSQIPVNYQISEIVLNVSKFHPTFYVKLTGCVNESVYIFGKGFFWLEAVIVGLLGGVILGVVLRVPNSEILVCLIIVSFAYGYPRAGISGIAPFILNKMLLLYVYIASPPVSKYFRFK